MQKENAIIFIAIILLVSLLKFFVPVNSILYDDPEQFKDSNGNYYLAKYDPYYFLGAIERDEFSDGFSYLGSLIYERWGIQGLYWAPVIFGILSCSLFFSIARSMFNLWPAFFTTLIFAVHPSSFFASAKGVFDRDFFLQFLEICILLIIWFVYKKKYMGLIFLVLILNLIRTFWAGWGLFVILSGLLFVPFIARRSKHHFDLICYSAILTSFVATFITLLNHFNESIGITNQLQHYNFMSLSDLFILPFIYIMIMYYFFKAKDFSDKFKIYFILSGICYFLGLGLFMMRFYYLGIPFMALSIGYILNKLKTPKLAGFIILFIIVIFSNLNQPLIIAEDVIAEAMADVGNSDLIGLWDYGNIYYGLSDAVVHLRGAPINIKNYSKGIFLPPEQGIKYLDELALNKDYFFILTSYDIKRFNVLSELIGPNKNNASLYLHMEKYFVLENTYDGANIDIWLYKRKQFN